MSISGTSTRAIGVSLLEDHPEKFAIYAPDGQKVCEFTMTLVEHPQVIGAWLLRVDSHPGDAATMVAKAQGPNLYWSHKKP